MLKRLSPATLTVLGFVPLALLVAIDMFIVRLPLDGVALHLVRVACMAWAVVFAMLAWVRMDEPAKEAHKFAWFWGGGGLMVLLIACAVPGFPDWAAGRVESFLARNPDNPWGTVSLAFVAGVLAAALAQAAGWAVVWAGWWMAKR